MACAVPGRVSSIQSDRVFGGSKFIDEGSHFRLPFFYASAQDTCFGSFYSPSPEYPAARCGELHLHHYSRPLF